MECPHGQDSGLGRTGLGDLRSVDATRSETRAERRLTVKGTEKMRVGVMGGSFDPVHVGHLILAETCREACRLDEVHLVPAAIPPHKILQARADAQHRLAMLRLAVAGRPELVVSDLEIARGGVSYTVDTLERLRQDRPGDELSLLLGSDSLQDFPTWREPDRIVALATLVVVRRAGVAAAEVRRWADELSARLGVRAACEVVAMPTIELSSSDLRQRVAAGRSIRFRTPLAVEEYIERAGLYRTAAAT